MVKKKVAFLIMNFSNGGGTERVTSVIANELNERKYSVAVISCQEGDTCRFPIEPGVRTHSLHGEKVKSSLMRKVYVQRNLHQYIKENEIEIVIAVDVALYLYLLPLQILGVCKCVAWEHFNYYIQPNRVVRYARELAAKYADCVVVLGKNDLNNYKTHYKKINNIICIYNPIAVNSDMCTQLEKKRAIAVGRLSYQKGFDLLVKAWALIEQEVPDWKLDIYGRGPMEESIQKQIDDLHLCNIELKGFATDIDAEYEDSSLFFLSSRYEGFVLVLMEAMAKGVPAVSFNCKEGPAEIVDDGVNGYLVEEGNVRQFANRAIELMKDSMKLKSFSEMTRKDIDRFSTETIMQKWEKMIDSL